MLTFISDKKFVSRNKVIILAWRAGKPQKNLLFMAVPLSPPSLELNGRRILLSKLKKICVKKSKFSIRY